MVPRFVRPGGRRDRSGRPLHHLQRQQVRYLARRARHRVAVLAARADVIARTAAHRRHVAVLGRRIGRRVTGNDAAVAGDDVALEPDGRPRRRRRLQLLLPLVLGVHREEAQHQEVHRRREDGEAEQDEDQAERHVLRILLQVLVLLQRHEVAEPDRRERNETIVERVEVVPAFPIGEHGGAADQNEARHVHGYEDEVRLRHLVVLHLRQLLQDLQDERDEDVQPLADALEHDQIERDADECVEHAEDLAAHRLRRAVAITCNSDDARRHGQRGTLVDARFTLTIINCNIESFDIYWHFRKRRKIVFLVEQNTTKKISECRFCFDYFTILVYVFWA